ncbi:MAG TPA: alpha-amylase family glycosyl hydrolase [Myxococcota bacterium]|nr:alpha-amylase family glycosyl hydrolase [Myxococcota bacterium]
MNNPIRRHRSSVRATMAATALAVLTVTNLACDTGTPEIESQIRTCEVAFKWGPAPAASQVAVVGEFNDWRPDGYALNRGSDGVFRGRFVVGPGRHAYRFLVDGEEVLDGSNPLTMYGRDGLEHSALVQPDCTKAAWSVESATVDGDRFQARLNCVAGAGGLPCDPESVEVLLDGVPVTAAFRNGALDYESEPLADGKHRLTVQAADTGGTAAETFMLPFWIQDQPFDWSDAMIYQIVVDRFRRGDGPLAVDAGITMRMGGDWSGVVDAIQDGYFDRLGVNALWISPAARNADGVWPGFDGRSYESYHGYWPVASREVEPRFGGEAGLDALVAAAHARGIRVLLDIVPNHVHIDHPWFADHPDWFNQPDGDCVCGRECSWVTDIERCWFTEYLPDLDWRSREVLQAQLDEVEWWLTRFDLDGLRVDAVPMMPRLVTRHLRDTVNRVFAPGAPRVHLVGETFTGSAGRDQIRWYLGPYGLSGQFDFPMMWILRSVVGEGNGTMTSLLDELDASAAAWAGSGAVMSPLIGNHDIPRFISVASGDGTDPSDPPPQPATAEPYRRAAIALAFTMTQPGAPVIYQGDEIGLAGGGDPDNRRPMPDQTTWNQHQQRLFAQVSTLGRLRAGIDAFRHGSRVDLARAVDHIAFRMSGPDDVAVVALNRGNAPLLLEVPAGAWTAADVPTDCFGGAVALKNGKLEMIVPALGMMVVVPRDQCPASDVPVDLEVAQ